MKLKLHSKSKNKAAIITIFKGHEFQQSCGTGVSQESSRMNKKSKSIAYCSYRAYSNHLEMILVYVLIMLLSFPLTVLSDVFKDYIDAGFSSSATDIVNNGGIFLQSLNANFSAALYAPHSSNSELVYLAVKHTTTEHVIWIANRDSPASLADLLVFTSSGNVALINSNATNVIWSANTTGRGAVRMRMMETGNLVLLDSRNNTVWESFSYPTDTLVTGQMLTAESGMRLVSSISNTNVSSGPFSLSIESEDLYLFFTSYFNYTLPYWTMTHDDRAVYPGSGRPSYALLESTGINLVSNDSSYISLIHWNSDASLCRATLESDGNLRAYVLITDMWSPVFQAVKQECGLPLYCGYTGVCSDAQCSCPGDLEPVNKQNLTEGCNSPFNPTCVNDSTSPSNTNFSFEMIGDNFDYFGNKYMSPTVTSTLDLCQELCKQNCSCSFFFFNNGSGNCYLYSLLGTIQRPSDSGHMLYAKTPVNENQKIISENADQPSYAVPVIVSVTVIIIICMIGTFIFYYKRSLKVVVIGNEMSVADDDFLDSIPGLPARFSYKDLETATNNFSNRLGVGANGSVYEGILPDGSRVAVKCLETVGQGKKEFQTEVAIIGNIHHMHLVRLFGFCAEGRHRLLVYEYMANGSLDKCLFKKDRNSPILDWDTRYHIALGAARGLAYLHNDCRETIIHCDIKPENILLDDKFIAKVSDFGLAKLLSKEQSQVFTNMRGTRGYLAPEWLLSLAISDKSDVYSFGMVLLEIISGRKNYEPSEASEKSYFPAVVFKQAECGFPDELVDEPLRGTVGHDKVVQVAKIALWCIQEDIQLRPSMTKVVKMLEGRITIPQPPVSSQYAVWLHERILESSQQLR